ncbi:MAG: hypothetical protein QOF12_1624 [Solirubrobacteraceae bacterium]|nr:hypothetical protein [Solirubrobacteraceae bacterium]
MTTLLDRLAHVFVAPAEAPAAAPAPEPGVRWLPPAPAAALVPEVSEVALPLVCPAPSIAVVCGGLRDGRFAGAAAALALLRLVKAPCALVAEWTGADAGPMVERPSVPAARRLVATLREQGHTARSAGRLAFLGLPSDEDRAVAAVRAAAPSAVASVLVVAGPRGAAIEGQIADLDMILIASGSDADAELTALAIGELGRVGPPVTSVELPRAPAAAALACAGVRLAAPLRAALLPVLEGALR